MQSPLDLDLSSADEIVDLSPASLPYDAMFRLPLFLCPPYEVALSRFLGLKIDATRISKLAGALSRLPKLELREEARAEPGVIVGRAMSSVTFWPAVKALSAAPSPQ